MNKAVKWIILAAAVCALLISVMLFNNNDKQQDVSKIGAAPRFDYKAPSFKLLALPNKSEVVLDKYKGKRIKAFL